MRNILRKKTTLLRNSLQNPTEFYTWGKDDHSGELEHWSPLAYRKYTSDKEKSEDYIYEHEINIFYIYIYNSSLANTEFKKEKIIKSGSYNYGAL